MRDVMVRVEQSMATIATVAHKRYESAHPFAWKNCHWRVGQSRYVKGHAANKRKAIETVEEMYGQTLSDHCADSVLIASWLCRKLQSEKLMLSDKHSDTWLPCCPHWVVCTQEGVSSG